jgi:hypothetical protein
VSKDGYTSIYVSKELKRQLVETARAENYEVGRGRGSRLAEFIATMLEEHSDLSQKDPALTFLHRLTPELRSSIQKLSEMDDTQQKRACVMLALLFDGQESGQGS